VTAYKAFKGLVANDPVVGPATSKALDDDLFFEPPVLDPAFAEFRLVVVTIASSPSSPLSWPRSFGRRWTRGGTCSIVLRSIA
jgi:hypothetical protein